MIVVLGQFFGFVTLTFGNNLCGNDHENERMNRKRERGERERERERAKL